MNITLIIHSTLQSSREISVPESDYSIGLAIQTLLLCINFDSYNFVKQNPIVAILIPQIFPPQLKQLKKENTIFFTFLFFILLFFKVVFCLNEIIAVD